MVLLRKSGLTNKEALDSFCFKQFLRLGDLCEGDTISDRRLDVSFVKHIKEIAKIILRRDGFEEQRQLCEMNDEATRISDTNKVPGR